MRSVRIQSLNITLCSGNGENILCDSTTQHWLALELESMEFVRWVQRCPEHLGALRSLKDQLLEPFLCTHLPAGWKCQLLNPTTPQLSYSYCPIPPTPAILLAETSVLCHDLHSALPMYFGPFHITYCLLWSGALGPPGAPLSPAPEALSAIL